LLGNICFTTPFDRPPPSSVSFCRCTFDWQRSCSRSFQQYAVQRPTSAFNWSKRRQSEYLAGRYCAIKALAAINPPNSLWIIDQLPIRDDHSPQWPQGTVGSISHSHSQAIAIAAPASNFVGLGIDCETVLSDSAAAEIAPWVLHPDDLHCKIDTPIGYGPLITLLFSAKESLFKALAPGHKSTPAFSDFLASVLVSRVTANTLRLNIEMRLNGRRAANSPFELSSSELSSSELSSFELCYSIDQDLIMTMALLRSHVPELL